MDKTLPTDAISLLEEDTKHSKIRSYIAVFFILFVTFAIPVTITQFYRNTNVPSSAAYSTSAEQNLQSYVVPMTQTVSNQTFTQQDQSQNTNATTTGLFISKYWWVLLCGIVVIGIWIILISLYMREKKINV